MHYNQRLVDALLRELHPDSAIRKQRRSDEKKRRAVCKKRSGFSATADWHGLRLSLIAGMRSLKTETEDGVIKEDTMPLSTAMMGLAIIIYALAV
jgi:hypothetical protein